MAFNPEKPELEEDLYALFDDEVNEVAVLIYESDEGVFYRDEEQWKELSEEDETEFDFDSLIVIYVTPDFIPVYDEAESNNEGIPLDELKEYESVDPNEISEEDL